MGTQSKQQPESSEISGGELGCRILLFQKDYFIAFIDYSEGPNANNGVREAQRPSLSILIYIKV